MSFTDVVKDTPIIIKEGGREERATYRAGPFNDGLVLIRRQNGDTDLVPRDTVLRVEMTPNA